MKWKFFICIYIHIYIGVMENEVETATAYPWESPRYRHFRPSWASLLHPSTAGGLGFRVVVVTMLAFLRPPSKKMRPDET